MFPHCLPSVNRIGYAPSRAQTGLPAADQRRPPSPAARPRGRAVRRARLRRAVDVRELIDRVREETAQRILAGVGDHRPAVRAAVRGWLWSMDGVCLDWVTEGDLERDEVAGLLLGTLRGTLAAAGLDLERALAPT